MSAGECQTSNRNDYDDVSFVSAFAVFVVLLWIVISLFLCLLLLSAVAFH